MVDDPYIGLFEILATEGGHVLLKQVWSARLTNRICFPSLIWEFAKVTKVSITGYSKNGKQGDFRIEINTWGIGRYWGF